MFKYEVAKSRFESVLSINLPFRTIDEFVVSRPVFGYFFLS